MSRFNYSINLTLMETVSNSIRRVNNALRSVRDRTVNFTVNTTNALRNVRGVNTALDRIRTTQTSVRINTDRALNRINALQGRLAGLRNRTVNIVANLTDNVSDRLNGFRDRYINFRARISNPRELRDQISGVMSTAFSVGATAITIGKPIIEASAWEKQFMGVKKLFTGSEAELKKLEQTLLNMSKVVPKTAKDIAIITASGLQSGVKKEEIVAYTDLVAKASVGFDMTAESVGNYFAKIKTQMSYTVKELKQFADITNYLADNTASSARDIVNVTQRSGGSLSAHNLSIEDSTALAGLAVQFTGSPEVAGSALNRVFSQLDKEVGKASYEGLKTKGLQWFIDYLKTFKRFKGIDRLDEATERFGKSEAKQMVLKMIKNIDVMQTTLDLAKSKKALNSLEREFINVTSTVSAKSQLMKNAIQVAFIEVGKVALPTISRILDAIRPLVNKISEWVKAHKELIGKIMIGLGIIASLGAVLLVVKLSTIALTFAFGGLLTSIGSIFAILSRLAFTPLLFAFNALKLTLTTVLPLLGSFLLNLGRIAIVSIGNALTGILGFVGGLGRLVPILATISFTPILLALTALAGAIYYVRQKFDSWSDLGIAINNYLGSNVIQPIVNVWNGFVSYLKSLWDSLKGYLNTFNLQPLLTTFTTFTSLISNTWNSLTSSLLSLWNGLNSNLSSVWSNTLNYISSITMSSLNSIGVLWVNFKNQLSVIWLSITTTFGTIMSSITPIWNSAINSLSAVTNNFKTYTMSIFSAIGNYFSTIANSIVAVWNRTIGYIMGKVASVKAMISNIKMPTLNISSKISTVKRKVMGWLGMDKSKSKPKTTKKVRDFTNSKPWNVKSLSNSSKTHVSFDPIKIENKAENIDVNQMTILPKLTSVKNERNY